MNQCSVFLGVFTYEFRMQIRRRSLWITIILIILLLLLLLSRGVGVDRILNSLGKVQKGLTVPNTTASLKTR